MAGKTKSLEKAQNAAVRSLARKVVKERFEDNTSAAARALGVSQSMLYEFISDPPRRGAGVRVLNGLASYLGWTIDDVIRGEQSLSVPTHLADDDETNDTIAFATKWLGVQQEAVDRAMALCKGGTRMPAKQLLEQLVAAQNALQFEASVGEAEAKRLRGEVDAGDDLDPPGRR
jgi:uncharacterized protein (DUF305 family)